jgi:hypothetical protein
MKKIILGSVAIQTLLLVMTLGPLMAQEFRGSITGSVTDPQGAWIPKASIVAKNSGTNETFKTLANDSGLYDFPVLPVGMYTITASAAGFRTFLREQVEVRVGEQIRIDFKMEIGAVANSITVTGEAELLSETTASQGQVIDRTRVTDLPELGRNPFVTPLLMAAGVQVLNLGQNSVRPFDNGGMDNMNINGSPGFTSEYLIDGSPDTNTERGTADSLSYVPSPDAVAEFKVVTNSYDAEYGRTGGGIITSTLKSGTNAVHGSAYYFFRNDKLYANRFDNNVNGLPRSGFHWNEPGGEVDGPVYLPKVYDGRNRTFFLFSWEGIWDASPMPIIFTVPPSAERQGNFSADKNTAGGLITIYDPLTTQGTGGTYTRQPFPGNQVPAGRMDPVALNIMQYWPVANHPYNSALQNNWVGTCAPKCNEQTDAYTSYAIKMDEILTPRNRLSLRFTHNDRQQRNGNFDWETPVQGGFHWRINKGGNVDLTSMLSPTTVLISRIGVTQHQFAQGLYFGGYGNYQWDPTPLGFPPPLIAQLPFKMFPGVTVTNQTALATGGGGIGDRWDTSTNWSWLETLNKVVGAHSMKFGGELRSMLDNQQLPTSSFGTFDFTPAFTQQNPLVADTASGDAFASFLMGIVNDANVPINNALSFESRYYAVFFQDDWRVTKKLTLNLGLRWDYESPLTERYNRINIGFSETAASPLQVPGMNLEGGLLFASPGDRLPFKRDLNNIQPRIGVAYQLGQKTVLRGGYGIMYFPTFNPGTSNGFDTTTPYVASLDGGITPSTIRLSNPYPGGLNLPSGSSQGLGTLLGNTISFAYPGRVIPYMHRFSAGFQEQLPWRVLVDASYEGSRSYDMAASKAINVNSAAQLQQYGTSLLNSVANPFQGLLPNTSFNGATVPLGQLLLPFPQFGGITENDISVGYSWYNAFQLRVEKRVTAGFSFLVSYTLSKTMQADGYLNPQNSINQLERVLTGFDSPERLVISAYYQLPSLRAAHRIVRGILGGWQANGIATFQTGVPIAGPTGGFPTGVNPADTLVGPYNPQNNIFNTCTLTLTGVRQNCASASQPVAWTAQPPETLRTMSSFFPNVRTQRLPNLDCSLFKAFVLHENLRLQLRGEAFNSTNTPWFGSPNTTVGSTLFGYAGPSQANDPRALQVAMKLTF